MTGLDTPNKQIRNLTALRGIAAILVVIFHFEILLVMFVPPGISLFFRRCYLMVDLFFVLSGFVMTHAYGELFSDGWTRNKMKNYLLARIARIYPLHFVSLLITILLVLIMGQPLTGIYNPAAIPANIFLLHSFGLFPTFTWNVPSWSISAEMFAYLFFPAVISWRKKAPLTVMAMMLFVIVSIYIILAFHLSRAHGSDGPHNLDFSYDYGYLRGLAGFLLGVVIYQSYARNFVKGWLKKDAVFMVLVLCLISVMHWGWNDLWTIPLFALLILSVAYNDGRVRKWMNRPLMQWLGKISFSIYLMQGTLTRLIVIFLKRVGVSYNGPFSLHLPYWLAFLSCIFFLMALCGLATLTYHLIEKPARNRIRAKFVRHCYAFPAEEIGIKNTA